ncbi:MAG: triosephosphate isomerase [Candidatus Colwellbacteria bacterium]|nr:triosephosphate isomerase [Candidatus Colwellbacteria bacterium]
MGKLIVANWKSNPSTLQEVLKLARASDFKNVVIAPPYPYLEKVGKLLKHASLGSQNAFWEKEGPYTGEVSLNQLKNLKVKYVIIGHSERRQLGETDKVISRKVKAGLGSGFKVILCVGENWSTRRKGITAAKRFVANQLKKDLKQIRNSKLKIRNLAIAYEPVWAISTSRGGKPDTPRESAQIMSFIRGLLYSKFEIRNSKLIYGGSVNPKNAKSFLSEPEIDGALVGGASLIPQQFKTIIKIRDSV